MTQHTQSAKNYPPLSSPTCPDCGDSGFKSVEGGVVRCRCCRKHSRPPDPAPIPGPDPAPVAFSPPAQAGNHRAKILAVLRQAGSRGVLNVELYKICLRPPSRLCELRQQGFRIETRREGESIFRFILHAEPAAPKALPTYEPKKRTDTPPPLFAGVLTERQ